MTETEDLTSVISNSIPSSGGEVWRHIPTYSDRYAVSSLGRVAEYTDGWVLKHTSKSKGYTVTTIKKTVGVHRLVALAFVPNPNVSKFNIVNHKDENKSNNVPSNLEWCDNGYNVRYSFNLHRNERRLKKKSGRVHRKKKTNLTAQRIGADIKKLRESKKLSIVDFARAIGKDRSYVSKLENGSFSMTIDTINPILNAFGCHIDIVDDATNAKPSILTKDDDPKAKIRKEMARQIIDAIAVLSGMKIIVVEEGNTGDSDI